ncbi:MAG: hypothetical protein Q9174_004959 [Haloplaca sp. 1 TL-2023]
MVSFRTSLTLFLPLFAACVGVAAATHEAGTVKDLAKKYMLITIKTDRARPLAHCDSKECFFNCEKDGSIGGTCTDTGECLCQSAPSALRIQQSRINKGDVLRPAEECDIDACNEVCYQKGGFAGGVCKDGACECVAPEKDGK